MRVRALRLRTSPGGAAHAGSDGEPSPGQGEGGLRIIRVTGWALRRP